MKTAQSLKQVLEYIDHKSYPAYKDTKGSYDFGVYTLSIDHVQGDPFASPSDVSIHMGKEKHGFLPQDYDTREKRVALQDYLLRTFAKHLLASDRMAKGSGKSGRIFITRPGQEILDRTACQINTVTDELTLRFQIGFPANGRTISSRELITVLFEQLPKCVEASLRYGRYHAAQKEQVKAVALLAEEQSFLRQQMKQKGLVAFVQNGAILPRESGSSNRPMKGAVPFQSPGSMEVTIDLPNGKSICGMGISKGITLIVGGGYHGKSTLLEALELGVYNHIAGDGREFVMCEETALKSRAEDGRPIHDVDISQFIRKLPNGKDTVHFHTEDASGSTSQAAGIVEGVASGAELLLIDEDTSATNFMIRDELMQQVVHAEEEPISPFIAHVRDLYEKQNISTILVAGSSGAYFYVADTIIQMKEYLPEDITNRAKKTAENYLAKQEEHKKEQGDQPAYLRQVSIHDRKQQNRLPLSIREYGNPRLKVRVQGMNALSMDHEEIDLRLVEQLADIEQINALGSILRYAHQHMIDGKKDLQQVLSEIEEILDKKGLEAFGTKSLARPRKLEIAACINRCRAQKYKS